MIPADELESRIESLIGDFARSEAVYWVTYTVTNTLTSPEQMTTRCISTWTCPLVLRLVKTNLEKAGYTVLTAADCVGALDTIACHLPDLIILDLMLPNCGIESLLDWWR